MENLKILAFGGNGNLGSEVLNRLIQDGRYEITLVSRGHWPFDSGTRIKPFVKHIQCNRENGLKDCPPLLKLVQATDIFHAILDFSAFRAHWVRDAIDILQGKVRVYVYVSSDSVYEVCEDKKVPSKPSMEEDAKRPEDPEKLARYCAKDSYGDGKLAVEEELDKQRREEGGFPWVALRFPDIVGPRDTTDRWILYQLWIKHYHQIGIPIFVPPEVVDLKQSLVYVNDGAQAMLLAMETSPENWNTAYNIAMEEKMTLWDTIQKIADLLNVKGLEQDNVPKEGMFHLYPSVYNGPINISKAKDILGFQPTPLDDAYKATVEWHEKAFDEKYQNNSYLGVERTVADWYEDFSGNARQRFLAKILTFIVPANYLNTANKIHGLLI